MNIFFSNRIERLYLELKTGIFSEVNNPFERRMVIVPSPAIKSWLMLEMAKDPDLKIAIGVEILLLDEAIEKLIPKQKLPGLLELSLTIEVEIQKMIHEDLTKWPKLMNYLKISTSVLDRRSKKRLIALSEKLASLFLQYGTFGGQMISDLKLENPSLETDDFQIELWKTLFQKKNMPYLLNEFKENSLHHSLKNSSLCHIHLFSLSFLSKAHFDFFSKISKDLPCFYYFLSPCQAFWSDIRSTKEQSGLKNHLEKKGISETQKLELDEYLRDQNPLLANFGKIGRQMAKLIEESEALTESNYVVSEGIEDHAQYEDYLFDDFEAEEGSFSLLKAIQADLTFLRNPSLAEKIVLPKSDRSIQVHVASSKGREVQILYDNLLKIIWENENDNPIKLNQIIVMAPDIMDYEPYINSVFGSDSSVLKYHLMDLEMPAKNPLIREFINLIQLAKEKFCAKSLLNLFNGAYFQKCAQLSVEDVSHIQTWLIKADLRWGHGIDDRNEWLRMNGCKQEMVESIEGGTLSDCIERFIASLAVVKNEDDVLNADLERLPLENIAPCDALVLGKFIALSNSLKYDLQTLVDGTEMSLANWASYLDCLLQGYFGIDETDLRLNDDELLLLNQFDEFRKYSTNFKSELFCFETIHSKLKAAFDRERVDFQEAELNSVRFCSMLPMRAIPASIVVLMGMNEDEFPRTDSKNSLDLCQNNRDCDYRPSKTDYDRYLFLESLLSARNYFILSYIGYSLTDASLKTSSLAITELISAIDDGYLIDDKKFSEVAIQNHPFNAYDKVYFEEGSDFVSYSAFNYNLATKFYNFEKTKKHQFVPHFTSTAPTNFDLAELVIDLKELSSFARNPLKTYFNKSLGIYLNKDAEFKSDEDFTLSPLDLAIIKKSSLNIQLKDVFSLATKKGVMPGGVFKQVAMEKISSGITTIKDNLKELEILPQNFFKIEFGLNFDKPFKKPNGDWQLPALKLNYQDKIQIQIVGSFQDVCSQGLVVHAKSDKVDVIKIWPHFLVFAILVEKYAIASNNLIFAKCGTLKTYSFDEPQNLLINYLSYYFKGLKNPSPLIPEWVFDFVYQKDDSLQKKIDASLDNDFSPLYNDYLHWMRNQGKILPCLSFNEEWKINAEELYLELYEKWYTK